MPPRLPTRAIDRAASASCTPWRASHVRRSKPPVDGGTGASVPLTSTIAPCWSAPRERSSTGWPPQPGDRGAAERSRPGLPLDHEPDVLDVPVEGAQRIGRAHREAVRRPGGAEDEAGDGDRPPRSPRAGPPRARGRASARTTRPRPSAPDAARAGSARPMASHGAAISPSSSTPGLGAHNASLGRRASSRAGPMPLTSSSSSTERKPPWAIAVRDDPRGQRRADAVERVEVVGARAVQVHDRGRARSRSRRRRLRAGATSAATRTCSPSASSAARLTEARSARGRGPPARRTASRARLPAGSR